MFPILQAVLLNTLVHALESNAFPDLVAFIYVDNASESYKKKPCRILCTLRQK
jgi:hypothetical protein